MLPVTTRAMAIPKGVAFPPQINASPGIKRGNNPAQIKSLADSRHLRINQIIGNAANLTIGAVAFTQIPPGEARMEAHTMRMG